MARKTALDKLNESVNNILQEYLDETGENVGKIAEAMGKEGVKALRRKSRETFPVDRSRKSTGNYARGWTMEVKKELLKTSVTIYNDHPALPHLLEDGHRTKNQTGKEYARTPGHPHIAPIEKELVGRFEREVLKKL